MRIFILMLFGIFSNITFAENSGVMLKILQKETAIDNSAQEIIRLGVSEIVTSNGYFLIDEASQDEALREQSQQREKGCFDETCLVDTGKMLAANKILIVELSTIAENRLFAIKFIDVESGSIIKTSSMIFKGKISDSEALLNFSKDLSGTLFNLKNLKDSSKIDENRYIKNSKKTNPALNKELKDQQISKSNDWDSEFYFDWIKLFFNADIVYFDANYYDDYNEDNKLSNIFAGVVGIGIEFFVVEGDWYRLSVFSSNISFGKSNEDSIILFSGSILKTLIIFGKFSFGISIGPLLGDAYLIGSNNFESVSTLTTEIGYNITEHVKLKLNLAPSLFGQEEMYKFGIVYGL